MLWQVTDNLSLVGSAEYFDSVADAPSRRLAYFVPSGLTPPPMSPEVAPPPLPPVFRPPIPRWGHRAPNLRATPI
ncbi:MAG: hypothetical protein ABW039_04775 [Sphingobium sp.]